MLGKEVPEAMKIVNWGIWPKLGSQGCVYWLRKWYLSLGLNGQDVTCEDGVTGGIVGGGGLFKHREQTVCEQTLWWTCAASAGWEVK